MKAWWAYSASPDDAEGGGRLPNPEEFAHRGTQSSLSHARVRAGHRDQPVSQHITRMEQVAASVSAWSLRGKPKLLPAGLVAGQRTETMIR